MNIRIYNCEDKDLKNEIRQLSKLILSTLIHRKKLLNNISISIKFDNETLYEYDALGVCWWNDRNINPRSFSILLRQNLNKKTFKKTLIHELIHIKQYLLNELKDFSSGHVKWKSTVFEDTENFDIAINSPWEKEAYRLSEKLYIKLCT